MLTRIFAAHAGPSGAKLGGVRYADFLVGLRSPGPLAPPLPFVWSLTDRGAAQVSVTRVTVTDRQAPPEPAPYGMEMARGGLGWRIVSRPVAIADLRGSGVHGKAAHSSGSWAGCRRLS
jgi:hypothetical protein